MANSEDYLDGLLDSVKTVRSDVKRAEEIAEESRKQREEQRNSRISPGDDFMEASGLHDYTPEPTLHTNLRRAFSEEDFLREFEEDLAADETDVDAFIRDFEEEINREEMAFARENEPSFMDSIEDIVNQAKEQIEHGEIPMDLPEEEEILTPDSYETAEADEGEAFEDPMVLPDMTDDPVTEETEAPVEEDDELPSLGEFEDELPDLEENGAMLDEDNADMDLMDLLSSDADLGDIGALLQADDEHVELEEAQEEFELQADAISPGENLLDDSTEETLEESEEEIKKPGFISKLLSLFSKKSKDKDETESKDVLDISPEEGDDISQENLDILKSLDEAEQEGNKKEKKRKEKKEKKPKEEKEKKQKAPREKKPKKEKVPDNSPKIPGKLIMVFLALGISVVVLITLGQNALGYRMSLSNARAAYNAGDYFSAYEDLMGVNLKEDDQDLFRKARLLGDLQKRSREYQVLMTKEKYPLVLDSLVIGVARYDENYEEAKSLGIEEEYKTLGETLVQLLSDQFGVSREEAVALYKLNREDYSVRIDEIIEGDNL
ncbi:MAG: hypothetical protein PUB19_03855 [Lachnospiraceae bacterium]|nr:hypothetical protein [Lachnospiraceae bacterium]